MRTPAEVVVEMQEMAKSVEDVFADQFKTSMSTVDSLGSSIHVSIILETAEGLRPTYSSSMAVSWLCNMSERDFRQELQNIGNKAIRRLQELLETYKRN